MNAHQAQLRQAIGVLYGPLRFARRSDQALMSLSGLLPLVHKAVENARKLPLSPPDDQALEALLRLARTFDAQDLEGRRRVLGDIVLQCRRLVGSEAPAPAAGEPEGRKRIRSLSAEGSLAPVSVQGEVLTRGIDTLPGIGPVASQKLAARGLRTFGDVLLYLPRAYQDRREMTPVGRARPGQHVLLRARVVHFSERYGRRPVYELEVADDTGDLVCRWFGFRPPQHRSFVPGAEVVLSGEVRSGFRGRKEIVHPETEVGDEHNDPANFGRIVPVYTDVEGVSGRAYRRLALRVVQEAAAAVEDFLPEPFRRAHDLVTLQEALAAVHFPPHDVDFERLSRFSSPPQRRLVFDELFFVQLGLALRRRGVQVEEGIPMRADETVLSRALARLPFALTKAQRRSLDQVAHDLARPVPMSRLLQGDVGSGKTAVALASALVAVENGYQAALMAPTELLAEQHFATFQKLLGGGLFEGRRDLPPVHVAQLSAGRKPKDLQRALNEARSGTARIVVGTHALIQEGVEFERLGLVIVDEQHRFGVLQRARLVQKGLRPHVLFMTATPIPRTLALTLYGDLDVSVIDELPPGRTPVVTRAFSSRTRGKAFDLVRQEVAAGRQAYVVLPLVEESEKLELRSAVEEAGRLSREDFRGLSVGLVHGRMSGEERSRQMEAFRRGQTQVLVATTVIEVGVDVPNASVMVIEHADRFGLSQLHQLRGRVGRGAAKSFCLLLHDEAGSKVARERLAAMVKTTDGFKIAEEDLRLRGPGEFLGTRQSGLPDLVVADLLRDREILDEARAAAFQLVRDDPELRAPEHRDIARELMRRWAGKLSLARVG